MLACAAVFLALKVVEAPRQGKVRALSQLRLRASCCSSCASDSRHSDVLMSHMRECNAVCKGVI
jgi:hypothetical protein